MRKQKEEKLCCSGSLTIFLGFVIVLLLAVVFAFLESARVSGMRSSAQMDTCLTADSIFAEYHRGLEADYGLLFVDGSYEKQYENVLGIEQRGMEFSSYNCSSNGHFGGTDFYQITPMQLELEAYDLATDRDGDVFRQQAVQAEKEHLGETSLDQLTSLFMKGETVDQAGEQMEQTGNHALDQLEQTAATGSTDMQTGESQAEGLQADSVASQGGEQAAVVGKKPDENPFVFLKKLKKQGILAIVAPDLQVSEKQIDLSQTLLKRELQTGKNTEKLSDGDSDALQKVWFLAYLGDHYANAVSAGTDRPLEYEMEYLVVGKKSDLENLKGTVNRILLMREGANALYLQSDAQKMALLTEVATAIAAATGTEAFIPAITQGLLYVWAYVESIADVRVLLNGGSIPLQKTAADWQTDLIHLSDSLNQATQKNHSEGLDYERYLQMLLFLASDRTLNYRSMDVIEQREDVRMDCMTDHANIKIQYEGTMLFPGIGVGADMYPSLERTYTFSAEKELGYRLKK